MTAPAMTGNNLPMLSRNPTQLVELSDDDFNAAKRDQVRRIYEAMYGAGCPLAKDNPTEADWVTWAQGLWNSQQTGMVQTISWSQRNRLFREGIQWLSNFRGVWREPPMPKDAVRVTDNQIGPGLDWALQIMAEQKPGWKFQPANKDPEKRQKAEAKQLATEYQYHAQNMRSKQTEAGYYAQTDGESFLYTFWNPEKGPWEELIPGQGPQPLGDVDTCVLKVEEVRVSPNSTVNEEPLWWNVRKVMASSDAVKLYGEKVLQQINVNVSGYGTGSVGIYGQATSVDRLLVGNETVDRYMVFLESNAYLPGGLQLVVVGNALVSPPEPLPVGMVTISPFRDGSTDPNFFPRPKMNGLIAPQMRVNMLKSKAYENIRNNAGGRLLGKTGAIVTETLAGASGLQLMEVTSGGDIRDAVLPLQGFSIGDDAKEMLQNEYKRIEDQDGWNDAARGQFADDASGRAILAVREQLERTFAPFVFAAAHAMSVWAKHQVLFMRWGYEIGRTLAVIGTNRPDLAREFSSADFDGAADCWVDPQTMMPMPESMKQFLLNDALDRQVIDVREWRKRHRFNFSDNLHTPDEIQEAKAMRVVEQLREGQPVEPIVWQDDEAIHQDILQNELILVANVSPEIQQAAMLRWDELAMQAQMKMGPMMGAPLGDGSMGPGGGSDGLPPTVQPFVGSNPSVPAAPMTDQDQAARTFEMTAAR